MAALKGELTDLKNVKGQISELEGKIEKSIREKDGLKSEIAQLKNEINSSKVQRREAEAKAQQQKQKTEKKKATPEKPKLSKPALPPPKR